MVMNIIRILILFLIIYAVVKGFKTLFKAAIIIFIISILLGLLDNNFSRFDDSSYIITFR